MKLGPRLFLGLTAAGLLSAVVTVVVALALDHRRSEQQALGALGRQADALAAGLPAAGARPQAQARVVFVGARAGRAARGMALGRVRGARGVRADGVRAALAAGHGGAAGAIDVDGRRLLYARRDSAAGPVVAVRAAADSRPDATGLSGVLVLAALIAAAVAAVAAAVLARRIVRPVGRLTAATQALAAGAPGVRVPGGGTDELAVLGRSFNAMADDLDAARDAQGRFLHAVSHELRTPLTGIRGWTEALREGAAGPQEVARIVEAETTRLERLVDDLLALAAAGSGDFALHLGPVDLTDVARAVAARFRGRAVLAEHAMAAPATGDRERLVQCVANLVDNAVRVSGDAGLVELATAPGRIEVADRGPGLSSEELEDAFVPMLLHRRHPERAGRSGLGLALVAELAGAMGGRASAHPRDGGGTVFRLDLPAATS